MNLRYKAVIVAAVFAIFPILLRPKASRAAGESAPKLAVTATAAAGKYPSLNERCVANIATVQIGGFRVLTVTRDLDPVLSVNDVTGLAWLPGNRLAYSVGGLFGDHPGLYVFDCAKGRTKIIVGKGEYFELLGASAGKQPTLFFFYSSDVARKTSGQVYQVKIDGSGLGKVAASQ